MKTKTILLKGAKAVERVRRIEAGYFDGRFKGTVIKDKKKEMSKNACKNYKY